MTVTLLLNNLKLNFLIFFYQSKQLTDYIYRDIYCKLSECIGQTPCLYGHLINFDFFPCLAIREKPHQGSKSTQ